MLRWIKRLLIGVVLVAIGTVFGPLLVAVMATLIDNNTAREPWEARTEGQKLVSAFRDEEKNSLRLAAMMPPPDGAECGYDPAELFPGAQLSEKIVEKRFTHYWGYFLLDIWRSDFEWEDFNLRVAQEIDESISPFQLGFLRRCITTTLARDICMSQVEELIQTSARQVPRSLGGTQSIYHGTTNDVVCLYADGVAARLGIPLETKEQDKAPD